MELSTSRPVRFIPGKRRWIPTEQDAVLASESVTTIWRRITPAGIRICCVQPLAVSPYRLRYPGSFLVQNWLHIFLPCLNLVVELLKDKHYWRRNRGLTVLFETDSPCM